MAQNIEALKYPIGKFQEPKSIDNAIIQDWIHCIETFPNKLKKAIENLTAMDFQKCYRPDGWTITQIIHHCADSHMNSFIRFKWALTESNPIIKPYFENLWAELPDAQNHPVQDSIMLLEGLHSRWVHLLKSLSETDLNKTFVHPSNNTTISLQTNIGMYAWHCEHHLAHILIAKNSN